MENIIIRNSDRFKSVFVLVNLLLPLKGSETSKNALLAMVLKKSNSKYKTEKELERALAKLYNASIDVSVEKNSDRYNIQFGIEFLNVEYIGEDGLNLAKDIIYNMICNPNITSGKFDDEVFSREKKSLIQKIEEAKDDKKKYALKQLEKEMFAGTEYGASTLGEVEDVEKITNEDLVLHYNYVLRNADIVITGAGNFNGMDSFGRDLYDSLGGKSGKQPKQIESQVENREEESISIKIENQDINQSILCMGLRLQDIDKSEIYKIMLYDTIMGGTPASKLFQNVREKESLAYFAKSAYNRDKQVIYMYAGIEPKNYEKAKQVMIDQIELLRNGEITDVEFNAAKQSLISTYREINDSKVSQAKVMLKNELYFGLQVDFADMMKNVEQVTMEDVKAIAKKVKITNIFLLGGKTSD